jgi:hypothetical protein
MALIERYRALSLRQKIALMAVSLARGQTRLAPILLAAMLTALVFCFSCFTAAAGGGESAFHAVANGKIAARLSTARFATALPNPVQRSRE